MHVDYDTPGTFPRAVLPERPVDCALADVYASVEDAFRRAVFNVAAVNRTITKTSGSSWTSRELAALAGIRSDVRPGHQLYAAPPDVPERQA